MAALSKRLFEAVELDDARALKELISHGAPLVSADKNREPALSRAAAQGKLNALRALLDAGADPAAAGRDGAPPLFWAVRKGQLEAVQALLRVSDPNARNSFGETALMSAAMSAGQSPQGMAILEALLKVADPSLLDPSGQSAVDWARKAGPRGPGGPLALIEAHLLAHPESAPAPALENLAKRRAAMSRHGMPILKGPARAR